MTELRKEFMGPEEATAEPGCGQAQLRTSKLSWREERENKVERSVDLERQAEKLVGVCIIWWIVGSLPFSKHFCI